MSAQESGERTRWRRAPELPPEVFAAWHKANRGFNPISIVATVEPDGTPHTAPFGSLRAVTPRLLRLCSWRGHDTYKNLCRDGQVTVAMLAPPNLAVSARGRARVIREQMNHDEHYAVVDIDIEEVKNDMGRAYVIETALVISLRDEYRHWFDAALGELEEM